MQRQNQRGNAFARRAAQGRRLREGAAWGLAMCCCMHWGAAHAGATSANVTNTEFIGARAQPLLLLLSTLVQSAAFGGTGNISLGNTTFR